MSVGVTFRMCSGLPSRVVYVSRQGESLVFQSKCWAPVKVRVGRRGRVFLRERILVSLPTQQYKEVFFKGGGE